MVHDPGDQRDSEEEVNEVDVVVKLAVCPGPLVSEQALEVELLEPVILKVENPKL